MLKHKIFTREFIFTILLIFILMVPNIFVLFHFKEISESISMLFAYLMLSIFIWIFPLIFLPKKVYFGIAFLLFLFSPLEIVFVRNLGIPMTEGFMESVFRTTYTESMEQITSNFPLLFLLIGLIFIYIFLFLKISNSYLPKKIRMGIAFLFFAFNGVLFVNMYRIQASENASISFKLVTAYKTTVSKYKKIYPADLLINTQKTLISFQNNKQLRKQIEDFTFGAYSNNDKDLEEVYVLIIGESARYGNFHINGYEKETTPNLDTIKNLLSFSNVYSGANVTTYSVPMMITRSTPEDLNVQNKEKSILDAFQEAGFYTAWFANQNSNYPVTRRLSTVADKSFTNLFDVQVKDFFDGDILPEFQLAINEKSNKKFIIIHTLGSHFRFTSRYPKAFEKFKPVMQESGYNDLSSANKEKVVNSYDNSILYTDYFLSEIIRKLNQTSSNTVLLYLSDHGENLFDDENQLFGHGTEKPTKYEYHIPMFVWYSEAYKKNFPDKIKQLNQNLNHSIQSTSVFYTLLDLANINYQNSDIEKSKSFSSEKYQVPKERFVLGTGKEIFKLE